MKIDRKGPFNTDLPQLGLLPLFLFRKQAILSLSTCLHLQPPPHMSKNSSI